MLFGKALPYTLEMDLTLSLYGAQYKKTRSSAWLCVRNINIIESLSQCMLYDIADQMNAHYKFVRFVCTISVWYTVFFFV